MNTLDAQFIAMNLMNDNGLIVAGWTFQITKGKGTYRLGSTSHYARVIRLTRGYIQRAAVEEVRHTILHEIAHALCEPDEGHGPAWRAMCRKLGIEPNRLHNEDRWQNERIQDREAAELRNQSELL